ncbi:MAG: tetratricopeptide repeat protein, partial [Chloroflexota bacterium]|nr:tetratricopeptide repeat protein [Chloroflexota bacterium]
AVNPWGFNYELPKVALFRGLTLLMAAASLLAYAVGGVSRGAAISRWLRRPLAWPVLLVAGAVLLSTLTSLAPLVSLWGSYQRQQGAYLLLSFILWTLLVAVHLRTPAQRRRLVTAIVVAGSLVALTPFAEAIRWHENPFTWRPGGALGNPIFLGAYLIMVIPFTLAKVTHSLGKVLCKPRPRRFPVSLRGLLPWGVMLALQLLALLVTQSRGPWVGALAGLVLFAALVLWPTHRRLVLSGLVVAGVLMGTLVAGLNFGVVPAERLSQLPYMRRVVAAADMTGGTVRVRLVLWQAAGEVVTTWPEVGLEPDRLHGLRPLVGYGPDTAAIVYTAAYPPELAHIEDPSAIWDRAHNETLDLLTMQGWLGLAAYLVLGLACARRGLALWRDARGPVERAWVAAPLAALVAHAVETQFAFSLTATGMMAWLCLAWLAASSSTPVACGDAHSLSPDWGEGRREGESRRWRVYAAVGALLLVLVVARVEGGLLWADTLVARARALDRAGQWKESIELYDRALALIPWQATWHQFRAESFYNLACVLPERETDLKAELLEAADRSLTRARHLEPLELEHYSNSGVLHAYWSDVVDPAHLGTAITFYQQAFRLAPTRAELRADLGHTYHNHGLYEKALEQYRAALEIDPQFAAAYYDSGLAWLALDRPDLAQEAFSAALELAPDCNMCWEALQALDE